MNKRIVFVCLFLLVVFFSGATPLFAENATEEARMKVSSARQEIKDRKLELQEQFKERMEEARSKWASRSAELKAKLQIVKDERKKKIVENIDSRISSRNETWVSHWNAALTRLSEILDKAQKRADTAASNGKNVDSVTSSIATAKTAIASAQEKVNTQAGKTYTVNITTEDRLGTSVSTTIKSFQTDVKAVISSINEARRAVSSVLKALALVLGESIENK